MALAIDNYDSKSESEILDELQNNDFTVSELENIYVYEKNNENRQSILEEIDTQLTVTVDVPERGYFGQWFDSGGRYTVRRDVKIQREIDQGDLQLVHYGSGAPSDEPEVLKSPIGHSSTHEPNGPDALFDQDLSTGASPSFQSLDTERVNNTGFVSASEGPSGVQQAIDDADSNNLNGLIVYGNEFEWSNTVTIPSEFTLTFSDGLTINVPDSHSLDQLGSDDPTYHLITNDDHTNGNANITIQGNVTIDGGNKPGDESWAMVWLHNVTDCKISGLTVQDVAQNRNDSNKRPYGILVSESTNVLVEDCETYRCGYEGISCRGANKNVTVRQCHSEGCDAHSMQQADRSPYGHGSAKNIEFAECTAGTARSDNLCIHTGQGSEVAAENIRITDCNLTYLKLMGKADNVTVSGGNFRQVWVAAYGTGPSAASLDSVLFDGVQFPDPNEEDIYGAIRAEVNGEAALSNWTFDGCHARHSDFFYLDNSSATVENIDFTNTTFIATTNGSGALFAESADNTASVDNGRVIDSRVVDANSVADVAGSFKVVGSDLINVNETFTSSVTDGVHEFGLDDGTNLGPSGTAERQFDTAYQNTNDYTIVLYIRYDVTPSSAENHRLTLDVGPTSNLASGSHEADALASGDISSRWYGTLRMEIPPGYHYQITSNGNASDSGINFWFERRKR